MPLAVHMEQDDAAPYLQSVCAVTEELTEGIDELLTPMVYAKLITFQDEHQQRSDAREQAIELLYIKECSVDFEGKLQGGTYIVTQLVAR